MIPQEKPEKKWKFKLGNQTAHLNTVTVFGLDVLTSRYMYLQIETTDTVIVSMVST